MKSPHPTPILKKFGQQSTSKRLSVTFSQGVDGGSGSLANASATSLTSRGSASASASSEPSYEPQASAYGLYYEPPTPTIPNFSHLQPSTKLTTLKASKRPELRNAGSDDCVLILGDAIHGQCLVKELENSSLCSIRVRLAAVPTKQDVRSCSFILILLPLEVIGSCYRVMETIQLLVSERADFSLYSAVVAVTSSHGREQHVTELLNLHTLLMQHRLSYYIWSNVASGSWPSILERLVMEITSCRSGPVSLGPTTRGRGASRAVLSSLLWPSDNTSPLVQEYLDVTAHKIKQDLDM